MDNYTDEMKVSNHRNVDLLGYVGTVYNPDFKGTASCFQSNEEVRKLLEQCDIITDNNFFIGMKSTGSRPPGELSWMVLFSKATN